MKSLGHCLASGLVFVLISAEQTAHAQTRDDKVRSDRESVLRDETWHYDNLESAFDAARRDGKPVMAVLRCIP